MQKTSETRSRVEAGLKTSLIFGASGVLGAAVATSSSLLIWNILLGAKTPGALYHGLGQVPMNLKDDNGFKPVMPLLRDLAVQSLLKLNSMTWGQEGAQGSTFYAQLVLVVALFCLGPSARR